MNIVFRADASVQMGIGHIMRCLTLADAFRQNGDTVHFICRQLDGHMIETIEDKKYPVFALDAFTSDSALKDIQTEDARACRPIIEKIRPDWLIVDHYALDIQWHRLLKPLCKKLMVIDDLADREHLCDVLLDQTYQRQESDYAALVPASCKILAGSQYALLRPEFYQLRDKSLKRRLSPRLNNMLISLGGTDSENVTGQVLHALQQCVLPSTLTITVVLGPTAPHLNTVQTLADTMPNATHVKVNVQNMAELMSDSDIAIGAAGTTTWERCCLGLPTITLVLADNQRMIAELLAKEQVIWLVKKENLVQNLSHIFSGLMPDALAAKSRKAMQMTDGLGVNRVISAIADV